MEKLGSGITDPKHCLQAEYPGYLGVLLLGVLHLVPERNDHVHLLHPDGLNLQAVSLQLRHSRRLPGQARLQLPGYNIIKQLVALQTVFCPRLHENINIKQLMALQTVLYPRFHDNINIEQLVALQTVFCPRLHDNINTEQLMALQTVFCPQLSNTVGGALHSADTATSLASPDN
jgi:hypothetical protein